MTEAERARNRRETLVLGLGFLLIFSVLAWFSQAEGEGINWTILLSILVLVFVYGLFALGLNLQFGFTGLVNFGHVGSMMIGAYVAAIVSLPPPPGLFPPTLDPASFPAWIYTGSPFVGLLAGIVAAVAFGLLVGIPTLRLREDYLAIVTIGASEIARIVFLNAEPHTGGTRSLFLFPRLGADYVAGASWLQSLGASLRVDPYTIFEALVLLLAIGLVLVAYEVLTRAPYGRVLKAIRDDEEAAEALGKNVFVYKLQALVLGGVVAAIAGSFLAWNRQTLVPSPDFFGPIITFYAYISMVLGGAGNNKGTILGTAILWGLVFEGTRFIPVYAAMGLSSTDGPAFRILFIGMLLLAMVMLRPEGVLGRKEEVAFGK